MFILRHAILLESTCMIPAAAVSNALVHSIQMQDYAVCLRKFSLMQSILRLQSSMVGNGE